MRYSADQIAFEQVGEGPPMLLVHGCPATHTLWQPLLPELARRRTVYAVDLPGFGASPSPQDDATLEMPRLVELLIEFADRHGMDRFDLVGHSYGGALAASIASAAPDRVRSLVMLTPMSYKKAPTVHVARSRVASPVLAAVWRISPSLLRRVAIRLSTRFNYGAAFDTTRADQLSKELDRAELANSAIRLIGAFDFIEYRRRLDHLERTGNVPMLALGARRDRVIPYGQFVALCRLLPSSEQEVFDDGVHMLMWQHPLDVARRIVDFIERPHDPRVDSL